MLVHPREAPSCTGGATIDTTSPVVARRWLARQMRAYREAAGLKQEAVAQALRCSVAKVSYAETAERPFRLRDLNEVLVPLYNVPADEIPELLDACKRSHTKGWWDAYDDDVAPGWYRYYLGLEQGASELRGFVTYLVPGLLQTPAYAEAIMMAPVSGLDPEEAVGRTAVRMRRQELLTRDPDPLHVHYVLDESVLRRIVGGPDVMRDQLAHLAELAERDNVTLQVQPLANGYAWDALGVPVILTFPWEGDPGVVFVEGRPGQCLEKPADIHGYTQAWEYVRQSALPPVESLALIHEAKDNQ